MQNSESKRTRRSILLSLAGLALVTAITIVPTQFNMEASSSGDGLIVRTSVEEGIPDFDIRIDKASSGKIMDFRSAARNAVNTADLRDGFVRGEEQLRAKVPTLKIEYSEFLTTPELIAPDPTRGKAVMAPPTNDRVGTLRNFLKENNSLIGGMPNQEIDSLKVQTDFVNKVGGIGLVILEQHLNDIPVFRGELAGHFSKNGELFRITTNMATGVDENSLTTDFRNPADAVRIAAQNVGAEVDMSFNAERSTDTKVYFGEGPYASLAWKYYFPIEPGLVRAAWYVNVWKPVTAYEMIIDAETGEILWRTNMGKDQTQAATYRVWRNSTSFVQSMDSPAPLTPGPINPSPGTQGTLQPSELITLIGNEAPNTFNNNGWITDGNNAISGNNTHAGLDRFSPNGVDEPLISGSPNRVFDFAANPAPGNPAPGDPSIPGGTTISPCSATAQVPVDIQRAAAVQMFYVVNRLHDVLYLHGFTEQTRNFQVDNFGRGGAGGDPVQSEGQDCAGQNNANMASSTTDGTTARMQMFLWTTSSPTRDGTWDADIVLHEIGHGIFNRNSINGTAGTQGGQMHEGNGDFVAHLLLSESSDPINGIYTTGGYSTLGLRAGAPFSTNGNYYYGIRRYPKAVIAFTGGPSNLPHNPLTYADIDPAQHNPGGGAFAPAFTGSATAVHDGGEIWSSMIWEVRSRLVQRLGHQAGTSKMLQLWMDTMRTTAASPTMLSTRNAMLQVAQNTGTSADVADVWAGFAARGLGFSAANPSGNTVVEAFDLPQLSGSGDAVVTSGNNLIEPNECNTVNIALSNNSAETATGISGVLSTNTPGVTISQPNSAYPDMPAGTGPINNTTPYEVSTDNTVACFTSVNLTLTLTYAGGGGGSPKVLNYSLPVGLAGDNYIATPGTGTAPGNPANRTLVPGSQIDDSPSPPLTLPAGWTSSIYDVPVTSLSIGANGQLQINGTSPTAFLNAALPQTATPTGPRIFPFWDDHIMTVARGAQLGVYTETLGSAPNRQLVIEWRAQHFNGGVNENMTTINHTLVLNEGSSAFSTYYTLTAAGANANGASATVGVQATNSGTRFTQFSFNQAVITPGMKIDWTLPAGQCTPGSGPCGAQPTSNARADFDGDGRTDVSVFRPSEGNWYLNQSTDGFAAFNWGLAGDKLVPGDYDGDGKADAAVFRANDDPGAADFYILNSNGFTFSGISWGVTGDVAVSGGDYDGDGLDDVAVFRPSDGTWYIRRSSDAGAIVEPFGQDGDIPMAMNHDGDSMHNLAVFRPTENRWYVARNTGVPAQNFDVFDFGADGDILVPADYDGDGRHDVAVFRPSNGTWYIRRSSDDQTMTIPFGQAGDIPVPGDYDGDGTDDGAVYRNGQWFVLGSTSGLQVFNFGLGTDIPIPVRYLPEMGGGGPGPGGPVTVSYTGPAVAIPDNNPAGVNITVPVAGVGTITDLNFRFDVADGQVCDGTIGDVDCGVNHTWVGDLIITLRAPGGSPSAVIFNRPGFPTAPAGCNNNNLGLILLTDQGGLPSVNAQGNPSPGACDTLLPFPVGNFSPANPLSVFNGINADGDWVLNVSDNAGADTGSVRRFSMIFNDVN